MLIIPSVCAQSEDETGIQSHTEHKAPHEEGVGVKGGWEALPPVPEGNSAGHPQSRHTGADGRDLSSGSHSAINHSRWVELAASVLRV